MMINIESQVALGISLREAQEREVKRSAKLSQGKKKKSAHSVGARNSQRAAGMLSIARGGRGITLKQGKYKKGAGKSVRGILDYLKKENRGEIVSTNCAFGSNDLERFKAAEKSIQAVNKQRPDLLRPVRQIIISPAVNSGFKGDWNELVQDVIREMEIPESCQYIAVKHADTKTEHVHLIFSQVGLSGQLWSVSNDAFRFQSAEEVIENKYGLVRTAWKNQGIKEQSKDEMEMQLRTEQLSTRAMMQVLCNDAMIGCTSITKYFERLEAAGFSFEITLQDDDSRISGIIYHREGETMKASDLGKKFTAHGLNNNGVTYVQDRDFETIARIKNTENIRYLAANGIEPENSELRQHGANGLESEAAFDKNGTTSRASITSNAKLGNRDESPVRDAHRDVQNQQSNSATTKAESTEPVQNQSDVGWLDSVYQPHSQSIFSLANAITSDSKSTRQQSSGASDSKANEEKPKFAQAAIKQLENLQQNGVAKFEISLHLPLGLRQVDGRYEMAPNEKEQVTRAEHFAKFGEYPKGTMFKRTLENISDFDKQSKFLYIMNELDVEIYVAPHPDSDHAVTVIDDLNLKKIESMKLDGFEPFCVVESSPSNFQAWVRLSSKSLNYDQRNLMTKKLAQKYDGDRRAVNGVRIGRLQGFSNRKLKHRRAFGQPPPCRVTESRQIIATRGAEMIKQIDQDIALDVAAKTRQIRIESIVRPQSREYASYSTSPNEFYRIEAKKIMQIYGKETKLSEMDFMIARTMLQKHFTDEQIGHAMQSESPQVSTRHSNLVDYVKRTIAAAKHRESQYKAVANANNKNNKFDDDFSHK